ncbi:MAG TPA: type II toxin-antitoxin system Phd/YefM family antitoxin [Tepidiformaceae bacterium]|nr:type II toxin-antitoxin system Phd/YefM family antitoxin [Tepidiformaceae bacterium]
MNERKSTWQLQEAKNKLSEVIRRAREEGPQTITVRGEEAAVVSSPRTRPPEKVSPSAATLQEISARWAPIFESLPDFELPPREPDSQPFEFDEEHQGLVE